MTEILFIGINIIVWGFLITSYLKGIRDQLVQNNKIQEQNKKYLSQILSRLEMNNYKDTW